MPQLSLQSFLCFIILIGVSMSQCLADTFQVNVLNDDIDESPGDGLCLSSMNVCTLRAAVMEANALPGFDVIELPAGEIIFTLAGEGEEAALTGDLDLTESVLLQGQGAGVTIINGNQLDRIFELPSGFNVQASLSNMTLTHGLVSTGNINSRQGGALRISANSEVTLQSVHFIGNTAGYGGAVYNEGKLSGDQVQWQHNEGLGRGGALNNTGDGFEVVLTDCLFAHNSASSGGALINSADLGGDRGQVSLDRCTIVFNQSTNTGIVLNDTQTDMTISNATISNNQTSEIFFCNVDGFV